MTLQELLDELAKNILRDRSSITSGPDDNFWSDETLVGYINEAERRLARQGLVLRDASTPSVVRVRLVAGVVQYTLHPSIIAVISAKYDTDIADMARAGHAAFSTYTMPDPLFFDPNSLSTLNPGKPLAYSTDEGSSERGGDSGVVSLRVYPAPTADYAGKDIYMRVLRKPLNPLTLDDITASPEVPEDYHLGLLDWAAYRALRNIDSDVGAVGSSASYKAEFEEMVQTARADMLRKLFTPLQWGFGRNGFSWVN